MKHKIIAVKCKNENGPINAGSLFDKLMSLGFKFEGKDDEREQINTQNYFKYHIRSPAIYIFLSQEENRQYSAYPAYPLQSGTVLDKSIYDYRVRTANDLTEEDILFLRNKDT